MRRRSPFWLVLWSLFTVINVGGAAFAAAQGEGPHAGVHVGLALIGAYVLSRLRRRATRRDELPDQAADARLERLQQSIDAIAIEVERIGEAQRFQTQMVLERSKTGAEAHAGG
jgi:hypothetical protein